MAPVRRAPRLGPGCPARRDPTTRVSSDATMLGDPEPRTEEDLQAYAELRLRVLRAFEMDLQPAHPAWERILRRTRRGGRQ